MNAVMRLLLVLCCALPVVGQERVVVDADGATTAFPHFWEEMFGSGRANLVLRRAYDEDLRAVKGVTGIKYIRGHGIFNDENGVYTEDEHGNAVYNFAYVDQIYDEMLRNGVRPVVEISFMPKKLAFNPDALHPFWYKPNVSPPKSMERWDALIAAFSKHLVERFGIDEVAQWYFEVWNEPNIDFWGGVPRLQSYFELYDHTARMLKKTSTRLRVGGPATAAADWVSEFLPMVKKNGTPIDFVSSHGYADDTIDNLFPEGQRFAGPAPPADTPLDDRVCLAIGKVKGQMEAAGYGKLPLFWTEWNVQGQSESRDTTFVGPGLADTIRKCDGKVEQMSFWTFSDVFEEGGPIRKPFGGEFGLRAEYGINKPSFYDFALLHQLGDRRLTVEAKDVIATKRGDGTLVVAAWNLLDPAPDGQTPTRGVVKTMVVMVNGVAADAAVTISTVDDEHGNVLPVYRKMGSPQYPTPAQVEAMNKATALPAPTQMRLRGGEVTVRLEPNALALLVVKQ